jgi:hypothetical protein
MVNKLASSKPASHSQNIADMNKGDKNQTRVPDYLLDSVALLQQHLDEHRCDVAAPSGHAHHLHLVTCRSRSP